MITQDRILAPLQGANAQEPVSEMALSHYLGVEINSIRGLLNNMLFNVPASLNRCQITRDGIAQMFYWPTGFVQKLSPSGINISHKKVNVGRVPPTPIKKVEAMPAEKRKTPFSANFIVRLAAENPNIHFSALVKLLIKDETHLYRLADDMVRYCFKIKALQRNESQQITLGSNQQWLIKNFVLDVNNRLIAQPKPTPSVIPVFIKNDEASSDHSGDVNNMITTSSLEMAMDEDINEAEAEAEDKAKAEPKNLTVSDRHILTTQSAVELLLQRLPSNGSILITKVWCTHSIKVDCGKNIFEPSLVRLDDCLAAMNLLTNIKVANN